MDTQRLKKYEAALKELMAQLQAELESSASDAAPLEVNGAMGRVSRGDAMQVQQLALEMKRRRAERLVRAQSALQRIGQGTYGLCGRCRREIGPERLEMFPEVVLCVQCAEKPRR